MSILVVGGAGFIGGQFVDLVRSASEHEIVVMDNFKNSSRTRQALEESGIKVLVGDIRDTMNNEDFADVDTIVNFAAETHNDDSLVRPKDFVLTNTFGTFQLLELARSLDARYHQVSTDEVFGDTSIDSDYSFVETSAYLPSSPYSASKGAADLLVMAWARSFDLRATISYCSNNFGPSQSPEKLIPRSVMKISRGERPIIYGSGDNIRDWIHVDDHVRGIMMLLEKYEPGHKYIFSGKNEISNLELMGLILEYSGSELDIEFVRDRPGHDRRYSMDPSTTMKKLGWSPIVDFRSGLRDTVEKLMTQGRRPDFDDFGSFSSGRG